MSFNPTYNLEKARVDRDARYGLRKPLQDWMAPVVYASGEDLELRSTSSALSVSSNQGLARPLIAKDPHALHGRGFDMLRFESELWESKFLALSGPAGIGKTRFIQTLLARWKDTGGFQRTLYVDCGRCQTSAESMSKSSMLHVLLNSKENEDPESVGREESVTNRYQSALQKLRNISTILVLDHLDTSHSDMHAKSIDGIWPLQMRTTLRELVDDLTSYQLEGTPVSIVFVGRHEHESWWKDIFRGYRSFHRYSLGPLGLANAIDMSQTILQNHKEAVGCDLLEIITR